MMSLLFMATGIFRIKDDVELMSLAFLMGSSQSQGTKYANSSIIWIIIYSKSSLVRDWSKRVRDILGILKPSRYFNKK